MENDFVDAPWAKAAVREIDNAIAEFNTDRPKKEHIAIAWGHPDPKMAGDAKATRFQHGLLSWNEAEIDVRIEPPDRDGNGPVYCRLGMEFREPTPLRLYPREIFNVLQTLALG